MGTFHWNWRVWILLLNSLSIRVMKLVDQILYKRDKWLEMVTSDYNLIAVSRTHGKSTTSAMLAYVLKPMGDDITAVVGAIVPQVFSLLFLLARNRIPEYGTTRKPNIHDLKEHRGG
ncbi:hypothetical protein MKW98_007183 [Papaver atlanticum]|uniref:Uncharacterized protein n=1 Tax=Papaver atlanticum TaxID=357466 RepID=A0AAD4SNB1_9MAGN|nr:hypothetical protein MKW98_007183 [Papaver atlanticum]